MMSLCVTHWSLQASPWAMVFAACAFFAMAFFSARAWRRSAGNRLQVGLLEGLRLFIGALVLFTLLRPERVVITPSEYAPEVAVLLDDSGSMQTKDVVAGAGAISRAKWLEDLQAGAAFDPIKQAYKTVVIPFNSKEEAGRQAKDGTDLSLALTEKLAGIRNLRAVLLVSDGDWNTGEAPVGAAAKLRARNVPVYCALAGSPVHLPDVELRGVKFPAFCLAREKVAIPFEVANHLPHEVRATVTITVGGKVQGEREITVPASGEAQGAVVWTPPEVGRHELTLGLPVQPGEVDATNNARTFTVDVRQEKLRVLVVESTPRWEYRYLRNALSRDPDIAVETLLLQPGLGAGAGKGYLKQFPAKEELAGFDVVFIGDIGVGSGEISAEQAQMIRSLVEKQGAGAVFLPGIRGRHTTWVGSALDDMLPVELDPKNAKGVISLAETRFQLTDLGSKHLLTMLSDTPAGNALVWRSLPGFTWNAAVKKPRAGADLLAVNPLATSEGGRMPVLAIRPFGSGQTLFMGIDSAWRWRKGVEDLYHYRFWGQVVRWMAHKRHLAGEQGVRLFYTPETPVVGAAIRFNALLHDRSGFPCQNEEVKAQLLDPEGKVVESFLMAASGGKKEENDGSYEGSATPTKSGRHTLKLTAAPSGLSLEATVEVGSEIREVVGRPARPEPLEEIARFSKGAYAAGADLPALVAQIKALPQAADIEVREPLWCRWWWGAILLGLLGVYWSLRKAMGMI